MDRAEVLVPQANHRWQHHSVLVVDDEEGMRSFLTRMLASRCAMVETAASAEAAQLLFNRIHFDLIILDITLPGKSGVAWLAELREAGYQGEVILITAFADIDTAINALRAGASDFILKPFRVDQILNSMQRCFDRARLVRENFILRRTVEEMAGGVDSIIGNSKAVAQLRQTILRVAAMPSTVLLQGESGVGKEVAARALHRCSPRAQRPFAPVNCAAISAELIESDLFGHVKGAFTGAADAHNGLFYYAQGGTLFLDEIAELPLAMQTKLLRVIEERMIRPVGSSREIPVDIRIIASTNRNLSDEVKAGRFRADLFYRLDVVNIRIPALAERREDVLPLTRHFLAQLQVQLGVPPIHLDSETVGQLQRYDWPGNVRELRNLVERSLILGYFPLDLLPPASLLPDAVPAGGELALDEVEKRHILDVLTACAGNKSEAARRLGISRKTMERKCAAWGVG
ncbi:MAG: sigma-54-dependent Fis family transcriptional regulator [Sterolibacteriaceae bacterium]|nr:sigma-54-dependent Fis family transcriptional regulator [Sterolibacteriaceae bacterium]MBK9084272.1 sigma-54-dependent Fis family transcriptional regulator [Sterolibacteriaceae bacterium]